MYDYGIAGNLKVYNSTAPPVYKLDVIPSSLPLALVYGDKDLLADPIDVRNLIKILSNSPVYVKELKNYAHLDFCKLLCTLTQRALLISDWYDRLVHWSVLWFLPRHCRSRAEVQSRLSHINQCLLYSAIKYLLMGVVCLLAIKGALDLDRPWNV